jgi:hypothetical protein
MPNPYSDTMTIEGVEPVDSLQDYYAAMQRQINSGMWSLQGSHGRAMMQAIDDGYCLLGKNRAKDYWGNTIPSRDDVQDGTKGSYGYVAKSQDDEWADAMRDQP